MPDRRASQRRGARRATSVIGAVVGVASVCVTRSVYCGRGRLREAPRSTGCGGRRSAASSVGVVRRRLAAHAGRRLRQHRAHPLRRRSPGQALIVPVRAEVRLVGDLARQRHVGRNAGAALHDRRRARLGARRSPLSRCAPGAGVDVRVAALVGMAAMFAGASRALLASVVFAFETTRQPMGLLPLLGGCTAAYLVSVPARCGTRS